MLILERFYTANRSLGDFFSSFVHELKSKRKITSMVTVIILITVQVLRFQKFYDFKSFSGYGEVLQKFLVFWLRSPLIQSFDLDK